VETCVENCPEKFFKDRITGECDSCPASCKFCDKEPTLKCSSCVLGYFLSDDLCHKCSADCESCSGDSTNCDSCPLHKVLHDNGCFEICPFEKPYLNEGRCWDNECEAGLDGFYYFRGGVCKTCDDNCGHCEFKPDNCLKCADTYDWDTPVTPTDKSVCTSTINPPDGIYYSTFDVKFN